MVLKGKAVEYMWRNFKRISEETETENIPNTKEDKVECRGHHRKKQGILKTPNKSIRN